MTKIVFMGTSDFAFSILEFIYNLGYNIIAFYTKRLQFINYIQVQKNIYINLSKRIFNIDTYMLNIFQDKDIDILYSHKADIGIIASYGIRLPSVILESFSFGCFNIHPSILPNWRGSSPIERCIESGDLISGITIIKIDFNIDTGVIYLKKILLLSLTITAIELKNILSLIGSLLIQNIIKGLEFGILNFIKQKIANYQYAHKLSKNEGNIIWFNSALNINCNIRAFKLRSGIYFYYYNIQIKIIRSHIIKYIKHINSYQQNRQYPGQIISLYPFIIVCGKDFLIIDYIQRIGKNIMSIKNFLNGFVVFKGDVL